MSRTPSGPTLWLALVRAFEAMDRVARQSMTGAGLGFSDFVLLEVLLHIGPSTPTTIGEKVGLTSGSVTTAIDRLARRGLVQRDANPVDGRSRLVRLTDAGRKLIVPAYAAHAVDIERVIASALTAEQRRDLFELLRVVQHAAEEELK